MTDELTDALTKVQSLNTPDKLSLIETIAKTFTDEEVRELILKLQKALCNR